jgi:hypothetical protein
MEIVGWVLTVVLAVPTIWLAALAYREGRRARDAATKSNELAHAALELATAQRDAESRSVRAAFVEKLRTMAALTDSLGFDATESQHTTVNEQQGNLQHEASVLGIPGATELAWYVSMVHFRPDARRRSGDRSPRARPAEATSWISLNNLTRAWITDPESQVEVVKAQGLALTGDSDAVFNIRQWPRPW